MAVRDVLEGMALVAQLSGLHAIMLVALALHFLRIPQCEAECTKLEECARRLRAMLQCPAAPAGHTQLPEPMAAGALLVEADRLVGSYRRSTLRRRAWNARSVEAQLRDARDCLHCSCALVLGLHVNLLMLHPASSESTNATDLLHAEEACDSTSDRPRYNNGTGQQGGGAHDQSNNTEPGGFESPV